MLLCKLMLACGLMLKIAYSTSSFQCPASSAESDFNVCPHDSVPETSNGSFTAAFASLKYHRKMMNEFLLSNYLSELLLTTSASRTKRGSNQETIEKRIDLDENSNYTQNMLKNEGSTEYKTWLERMNEYNAKTREFIKKPAKDDLQNKIFKADLSMEKMEDYDYGFDYGDVTGYGPSNSTLDTSYIDRYPAPSNILKPRKPMSKTGYESVYDEHKSHYIEETPLPVTQKGKEIGLSEIADITMTTLAFLSFGTFILQVLICITMGKDDANMALQADGTETQGVVEEIRRRRRSIDYVDPRLKIENELSHLALRTIDTLFDETDEEDCRNWRLCMNIHLVKRQKSDSKLWIPLWSLSLTWLRSNIIPSVKKKQHGMESFNSFKAIVLGLVSDSNCKMFYKKKCNKKS